MAERTNFRAFDPATAGEEAVANERRFRAAVETAFGTVDFSIDALNRLISGGGASGCCGNVDGGQADTNFGGIFCPVDGGNASGTTDPAP